MTQAIRTKPFMPPTKEALANEAHRSLMRLLFARALGHVQGKSAESIVREHWSSDAAASLMTKSSVTQTGTSNSGLPLLAAARVLPSLSKGAGSRVLAQAGIKLDFSQAHQFSLPFLVNTLPDPTWVSETGAFPVEAGTTGMMTIGPTSKLGFMLGFTNEFTNYAIADAYELFSRMMQETAKAAIDKPLFSTAAATSKSQAGLLWNVTPLAATAGGGIGALVGDLKQMAVAMAAKNVSSDGAVIVANAGQAVALNTLPPQPLPYEVYDSVAVPPNTVIMLQPEGLVSGYDGEALIFMSPSAVSHMEDTNPTNIGTAGTPNAVAVPATSSFQTDSQMLKLVLRCAWGIRPGAIEWISGTTW